MRQRLCHRYTAHADFSLITLLLRHADATPRRAMMLLMPIAADAARAR